MQKFSEAELILNRDGSVYHLSLKPRDIADTIITVGDPGRVHMVSNYFDRVDFEMNKREFITHTGMLKGKKITVISTGMGTDNIEILMTELDALVNIDLKKRQLKNRKKKLRIIRVGTSGAIQEDIPLGSHIRADCGVGLDNLMNFYNLRYSEFEKKVAIELKANAHFSFMPYCVKGSEKLLEKFTDGFVPGNTVTSPGFYAPQGREIRLPLRYPHLLDDLTFFHYKDFWLTNFEMETAAYYGLARLLGHEMVSLNAIVANRVTGKHSRNPNRVVNSLIRKVIDLL